MTAIRVEPLRESAQRALVEAHLAAGNLVEASRVYELYRELLRRELSVEPSSDLTLLLTSRSVGAGRPWESSSDGTPRRLGQVGTPLLQAAAAART
jgi:DNA-binding SARP family transcriptional activator